MWDESQAMQSQMNARRYRRGRGGWNKEMGVEKEEEGEKSERRSNGERIKNKGERGILDQRKIGLILETLPKQPRYKSPPRPCLKSIENRQMSDRMDDDDDMHDIDAFDHSEFEVDDDDDRETISSLLN